MKPWRLRGHHDFMWGFTLSLISSLKRPVFYYLISLSFSLISGCSVLVYWAEGGINSNITSYFDALYYSVTIMTGVGLGDIVPVTFMGRLLSMGMMLLGTGVYVCFTAVLAASILEIEFKRLEK